MTSPHPMPPRYHCDGWTPGVQAAFLDGLIATGSVKEAARLCGKTPASAYRLRAHPGGAFKADWQSAIGVLIEQVRETAIDRAFNGRVMPVIKDGAEAGEKRVFNDGLLIQLMRLYDAPAFHAERAAAAALAVPKCGKPLSRDEIEAIVDAALDKVEQQDAAAAAAEGDDRVAKQGPNGSGGDADRVAKQGPNEGEADACGVSSNAPPTTLQAGLRSGWRQSG